ncbi:TatD family [Mortierella sp. GBAus27b]|nr:TatD family [Mortierella sp. GBAus27b]
MGVQPSKDLGLEKKDTTGSIVDGTESLSLITSSARSSSTPIVTVTWNDTDRRGDWDLVSKLAKDHPDRFVPCFGIHPWFTHKYKPLEGTTGSAFELRRAAGTTPKSAAGGTASPSLSFSSSTLTPMPEPGVPHPNGVLGEIGLDRTARKRTTLALTSIQHQLDIVREQLKIAAMLNRPVSFHCVQAYGHWHDFLIQEGRELKQIEDNLASGGDFGSESFRHSAEQEDGPILPPRLCMHSYGGSVDTLKALTKLGHPPEIFFSFSIVINGRLQEQKLKELIMAVPEDRLLIESDHHSHSQVDGLLVEMVQRIANIRGWTDQETVDKTCRNWHRFVYG